MAIYLTKQTVIDGVLTPVGKRLDKTVPAGTCRSLIRAGRALVRPARGEEPEPPAPTPEEDPEEIEQEDDSDLLDAEAELFDDGGEAEEIEQDDDDSDNDVGGVAMDEVDDDPAGDAGSSDAESGVPAGDDDADSESISIHSLGLSRAISNRLDSLGIKTKSDALAHAAKNGGRFGEELPGIGDVKAERINAALGL